MHFTHANLQALQPRGSSGNLRKKFAKMRPCQTCRGLPSLRCRLWQKCEEQNPGLGALVSTSCTRQHPFHSWMCAWQWPLTYPIEWCEVWLPSNRNRSQDIPRLLKLSRSVQPSPGNPAESWQSSQVLAINRLLLTTVSEILWTASTICPTSIKYNQHSHHASLLLHLFDCLSVWLLGCLSISLSISGTCFVCLSCMSCPYVCFCVSVCLPAWVSC